MIAGIAFAIGYGFMSFIFSWDEAVMGDEEPEAERGGVWHCGEWCDAKALDDAYDIVRRAK